MSVTPAANLARYAMTGCRGNIVNLEEEIDMPFLISLCKQCNNDDVAKITIMASEQSIVESAAVALYAYLSSQYKDDQALFNKIIKTGNNLWRYVKLIHSGITGRKSLGNRPKRFIANWFNARTIDEIITEHVDTDLTDVINLAHPAPLDKAKAVLYRWVLGIGVKREELPYQLQQYCDWKEGKLKQIPQLPLQMLVHNNMKNSDWCNLALNADHEWLCNNWKELLKFDIFRIKEVCDCIFEKLNNASPYRMVKCLCDRNKDDRNKDKMNLDIDKAITNSVMKLPLLGGSGILMINKESKFKWKKTQPNRNKSITDLLTKSRPNITDLLTKSMERNICRLTSLRTFKGLNLSGIDWVICVFQGKPSTVHNVQKISVLKEWDACPHNPNAKLVCLDTSQAYTSTFSMDRDDILLVGGFSDVFFDLIPDFLLGKTTPAYWQGVLDKSESFASTGVVHP